MSRLRIRFFVTLLILLTQLPARALDFRDLSFYAPFDGSFEPLAAAGDPGFAVGPKPPTFADGRLGQALVAGDPGMTLSYAVEGNIHEKRGTLAMWLRPHNWRLKDDLVHHVFLRIPGRWNFHWNNHSFFTACYWTRKTAPWWWGVGGYPPGQPDMDAWTFMAVTWGDGECVFYHNGRRLKHAAGDPPDDCVSWTEGHQRFHFSDANECWKARAKDKEYNKPGLENQTCFDEFMIFRRPLKPGEILALYRKGVRDLPRPRIRIGKVSAPPTVDGDAADPAWATSAAVTGFVDAPFGNLAGRDVRARLCYDDASLYVLVRSPLAGDAPGGGVEVWLAPGGEAPARAPRHFRIGSDGALSTSGGVDGERPVAWRAARRVSGESPTETVEIAVPFAMIGLDPRTGGWVRANIVKSWSSERFDRAAWADVTLDRNARVNAATYAEVALGGAAPVLALESFGDLNRAAILALTGRVANPSDKPRKLRLTLRLQPSDLRQEVDKDFVKTWSGPFVVLDRDLEAGPGATGFDVREKFRDMDINSILIEARDEAGGCLYRQQVPFCCTPPILANVRTFPERGRVEVELDVSGCSGAALEELAADIVLTDEQGREAATATVAEFASRRQVAALDLHALPFGEIAVKATLRTKAGERIADTDASFAKLKHGPWRHSLLGLDDMVLPPFEPIRVSGQTVSVWNRRYVWRDSLLPVQVLTNGREVLAAPMELYASDKPAGAANQAELAFTMRSETAVEITARAAVGGAAVLARTRIEYDGMAHTEIAFAPSPVRELPRLALVIPLKSECAWLYHYKNRAGAVAEKHNPYGGPMNGERRLRWQGNVWLGTPEQGLTWFNTGPGNWRLQGGNPRPLRIADDGAATTLTVAFAESAFPVSKPASLSFGFIATPVKPMPENWRFIRQRRDLALCWVGAMMNSNNHVTKMNPKWPETVRKVHESGRRIVAYVRPIWINLAEKETRYYWEEWKTDPYRITGTDGGGVPGENQHLTVSLASDWADFQLHHLMKIRDASGCDGFYFDGTPPLHDKNPWHGAGYVDASGERQPTYSIPATRRFLKRIAMELHKRARGWQDYVVYNHQSGDFSLPAYSFATLGWDGEQFSYTSLKSRDYTKLMSAEAFLAEFHGKQFGYPVLWLNYLYDKSDPKSISTQYIDTALCLAFVTGTHELAYAGATCPMSRAYLTKVLDRADAFGLSRGRAEFVGWWETRGRLTQAPPDPKLKCSLWQGKGRALVVLGNANGDVDRPAQTTVTLVPEKLGLSGKLRAIDWWTKDPIAMTGTSFTIRVPGSGWRLVAVEGEAEQEAER